MPENRSNLSAVTYLATVTDVVELNWVSDGLPAILGFDAVEAIAPDWWARHIHPEDRRVALKHRATLPRAGHVSLQYRFARRDGQYVWLQDDLHVLPEATGLPLGLVGTWMLLSERVESDGTDQEGATIGGNLGEDLLERKRVEAALQESEAQYRNLFETMTQGVIYYNPEGRITSANPAAGRILGLTLDQILGRTSLDPRWHTIHEDGSPFPGETQPPMVALLSGQPICDILMGVFDPKEQQHRWVIVNAMPQFRAGEALPFQVYATMVDITERKQAENELRRLSQAAAVAEERQRLARELHDSVTQALYSLSLIATGGKQAAQTGDQQLIQQVLEQIDQTVQRALRDMRLLIYELRPTLLEQEGLAGALRQRLDLVEERAGVQTELSAEGQWELPPGVEIALYGIAQEALNNTLKHAHATKVTVQLKASAEGVTLEICDNGQGFDPHAAEVWRGLGLTHLRERAAGIGGTLSLVSQPGEGTRVKVAISPPGPRPTLAI